MTYVLEPELVPEALWGKNLSERHPTQWAKLRTLATRFAGFKCEICSGKGEKYPVEIHEVWRYSIKGHKGTQVLVRLIALCPMCHYAKHYGRSALVLRRDDLKRLNEHICKINEFTIRDMHVMLVQAKRELIECATLEWSQDLSNFLAEYKCQGCGRKRDLRPVVTCQDQTGITKVEWVCRYSEVMNAAMCECHGIRISVSSDVRDYHNVGSGENKYTKDE